MKITKRQEIDLIEMVASDLETWQAATVAPIDRKSVARTAVLALKHYFDGESE